jgi:hypothetical protein
VGKGPCQRCPGLSPPNLKPEHAESAAIGATWPGEFPLCTHSDASSSDRRGGEGGGESASASGVEQQGKDPPLKRAKRQGEPRDQGEEVFAGLTAVYPLWERIGTSLESADRAREQPSGEGEGGILDGLHSPTAATEDEEVDEVDEEGAESVLPLRYFVMQEDALDVIYKESEAAATAARAAVSTAT